MSLHLESPMSDSKMDTSDTTTSLDSVGVSPIAEDDANEMNAQLPPNNQNNYHRNEIEHDGNQGRAHVPIMARDTQNEDDSDMMTVAAAATATTTAHLDNRIVSAEIFPIAVEPTPHRIARTLANNSHPLMSPTNSESDQSGHDAAQQQPQQMLPQDNNRKCHNFPDVVPRYEHIQSPPLVPLNAMAVLNLNNIHGKVVSTPAHNKLALLRAHSPDLLSSESDADISQYHAAVEANFQSVALLPNTAGSNAMNKEARRLKKCRAGTGCDDISSLDSISNHSFDDDEDIEHNLASLSPSSSLIDGLDEDDDSDIEENDFPEATTPTPNARTSGPSESMEEGNVKAETETEPEPEAEVLPQYSAAEERRDSRNWQKITLPDGRTREIDMRVIEPYKRVLSHGGYLKAGGHNAIVIFCACHLPDRSRADYNYVMDNLFLYVVKTLDQLVTEDYVLIYLHGGSNRRNVPPFPWLKKCYQLLDRRLRKSLKNMYLVHPTFWIKSIVWMARPFVSTKFWRKLIYVKSLDELSTHVTVEKAAIPEKVKQYDAKHN